VPERRWDGAGEGSPGRGRGHEVGEARGREKLGFQHRERLGIPTVQAQGDGSEVTILFRTHGDKRNRSP